MKPLSTGTADGSTLQDLGRASIQIVHDLKNPLSTIALEACLLGRVLEGLAGKRDPIAGLAPAFFAEVPALLETPWAVATADFMHPSTRGQRPADFETRIRFGVALTRLAAEDPAVHRLTAEVSNLLKPRSAYRDPALMQRVSAIMTQM